MLNIQVVGPGCRNCEQLETLCKEVVQEKGFDAHIEKVTDINKFTELGVMLTPGLIVNGGLKSSGKIPTKSTLEHWLAEAAR